MYYGGIKGAYACVRSLGRAAIAPVLHLKAEARIGFREICVESPVAAVYDHTQLNNTMRF